MALPESSTASCEAFSVAPCLRENTKKERTSGCSGAAEPGVFGWKANSRHPLIAVVRIQTDAVRS